MGTVDKRVNQYISKSQDFAQSVLDYIRECVHEACPEAEETMKWGFPHFIYKKEILCSMAAFKQHCALTFWKASLLIENYKILKSFGSEGMGNFGKIKIKEDLPTKKQLIKVIKAAAKLNEQGIKVTKLKKEVSKKELEIPEYFLKVLNKNKKAKETFNNFSYSHKKEYLEWITEAKTEETRNKRIATALEWLVEGKPRNWKYMKK